MNRKEYLEHWITNILSDETILENNFDDWMWCPERYSSEEIVSLKFHYEERKGNLNEKRR